MSDQPSFPDPFDFFKRMWMPFGVPVPGLGPPLDEREIDKRIADLRSVEQWLAMNLNLLRMSIQGLEMQKAMLTAVRAMQPNATAAPQGDAAGAETPASAAEAWWQLFQQARRAAEPDRDQK